MSYWNRILDADTTIDELRQLRAIPAINDGPIPHEVVRGIFEKCGALWLHSGNPLAPHAELTSGKCSDGFIDTLRVLKYSNLRSIFALQLARKIRRYYDGPIDWVVGSDHAAATFSSRVSEYLYAQDDFTAKVPNDEKIKTQAWKRFDIEPEEVVLQVEELVTTTITLAAVRYGIRETMGNEVKFAPIVATLIHRSNEYELEGNPIIFLAHFDINVWDPKDCPLCAGGSKRVKPKTNWAELTAG